jgi:putative ATPase
METDGLFSLASPDARAADPAGAVTAGFGRPAGDAPLPVRMRPVSLDELIGQEHLLAPGAPLRQLVTGASPMSVILWGPPGTGKTTIAHLVANATDRKFVAMSALTAGVKDVRAVIDTARRERRYGGPPTVLFIDEVHRFSKTQQDSLLAAVEDRTVTLLAATTENPYFSVISPLLSRCVLLTLQSLGEDHVRGLLRRATTDERGLGGAVTLTAEAEDHLVRLANGDVRKALTALEAAAGSALAQDVTEIDLATAEKAVDVAAVRYDRDGDAHYDVISAFIKSMRGSDPDAALHYLARMLVAGEDPRFIARRIVIFASEDVGMADPQALLVATAAAQAVQNVGLPEAGLNLAHAVVHLATAPKSNSVTVALGEAMADVRAGRGGAVPPHLRDAHYPGSRGLGHGRGYRYPHDDPRGVVRQQYVPDDLVGTDYYRPTDHGAERAVGERVPRLRRIVRGLGPTTRTPANPPVTTSASTADRAAGGARPTNESQSSADSEPVVPVAAGNGPVAEAAGNGTAAEVAGNGTAAVVTGNGAAAEVAGNGPVAAVRGNGAAAEVCGSGADAPAGGGLVADAAGDGPDAHAAGNGPVATASGRGPVATAPGEGLVAEVAGSGAGAVVVAGSGTATGDAEGSSDDSGDSAGKEQR